MKQNVTRSDDAQLTGQKRLRSYLREQRIDAEIIFPGADTPTVPAAAEALGVRPDQIVKSLLFSSRNGQTALAIVRGTAKVDRRKLSKLTGMRKPKLATPETVLEKTGYAAGGTPPIGHREQIDVYLDDAVFEEPVVFGGGGEIDAMLRITPAKIQQLTSATVASICEDD
jgi:Cys-tRNA(Pro) deacylase